MKTKRSARYFIPLLVIVLITAGCSNPEEDLKGTLSFEMNDNLESGLKALDISPWEVTAALVSIKDEDGVHVYEKERLEFYSFGNSFVTTSLELKVGKYRLTEFFLVDSAGNVTWATPVEGSELAPLVDDPLPINFRIIADRTTHVHPQVVRVADHSPDDFGYADFHVDFVERFCVAIEYESPCPDWYAVTPDDGDSTDSNWPVYPAILQVWVKNGESIRIPLTPGYNEVFIPRGYDHYRFVVRDCGSTCYREEFSAEMLLGHSCYQGEPIFINCDPDPGDIIITPEELTEPTIDQGVFGQVTYMGYETDEHIPVVRDIYFYHYPDEPVIDSLLSGTDCYFFQEIAFRPAAVVRSNSSGYYQVPLEAGPYLYMVKTEDGFYIDLHINSHLPGKVKVSEGEVSDLDILITPCY